MEERERQETGGKTFIMMSPGSDLEEVTWRK